MFSYLYHQEDFQDPTEDQKAGAKGVGKMGFYEDWIEEDEDNRPTYEEAVALMQQEKMMAYLDDLKGTDLIRACHSFRVRFGLTEKEASKLILDWQAS